MDARSTPKPTMRRVKMIHDHEYPVTAQEKRPALVRGDCGQGGEPTMAALEARAVHYLFKLRLTKNVKRYIERSFASGQWCDAGQGWQAQEGMIQLMGWSRARRTRSP